jgi:hypothetical protein
MNQAKPGVEMRDWRSIFRTENSFGALQFFEPGLFFSRNTSVEIRRQNTSISRVKATQCYAKEKIMLLKYKMKS